MNLIILKKLIILFFSACVMLCPCDQLPTVDWALIDGFKEPGVEARPRAYWNLLNGDVSLSGITRDMEEAKKTGHSGLQIWDWKVEFDSTWGAPALVDFPKLISWTEHENPGIKYYSGKGIYRKSINVPKDWKSDDQKLYLDLGQVREMAEVFVNGKSAGIIWKTPFRTAITDYLQEGENEPKIEVVNLWINCLTGDKLLPEEQRFTKTNIQSNGGSWLPNYSEWQEEPAGLFGPVRVLFTKTVELK